MRTLTSGLGAHVMATSGRRRRLAAFCELANVEIHRHSSPQPGDDERDVRPAVGVGRGEEDAVAGAR